MRYCVWLLFGFWCCNWLFGRIVLGLGGFRRSSRWLGGCGMRLGRLPLRFGLGLVLWRRGIGLGRLGLCNLIG
ncbi:hypothetical protein CMI38_01230 [Candidatus Pacearchaeota archaeon]|nr:hypothetical protein [Candidatus Pacearchaeota archaeon]